MGHTCSSSDADRWLALVISALGCTFALPDLKANNSCFLFRYEDNGVIRPIIHRASLVEMVSLRDQDLSDYNLHLLPPKSSALQSVISDVQPVINL